MQLNSKDEKCDLYCKNNFFSNIQNNKNKNSVKIYVVLFARSHTKKKTERELEKCSW